MRRGDESLVSVVCLSPRVAHRARKVHSTGVGGALLTGCLLSLVLAQPCPAQTARGPQRPVSATDGPSAPVPPEVVARDVDGRVTVRAVRLTEPLRIDGTLEERVYREVPAVSDFLQQEPHEGEMATERTEIWVFFDQTNIYISARCLDSQPEKIIANEMRRDSPNITLNDNFGVILDTFHDRRNGFVFQTNAVGGMSDGYVTDERDNRDWNTVWVSKSRRFDGGWTVEMAIPFKSLRYNAGASQVWGVNFRRIVRRKNEFSYLTRVPASYGQRGLYKVSAAATLVGIEPPGESRNLEVKPYVVSGISADRAADPSFPNELKGDVGVDAKYGVTRSLTFDFTYNTDFAQVEQDEQQLNLTRFGLFFPEKREFFLEGQGIFAFGGVENMRAFGGGAPDDTPVLFLSRQIGLSEGRAVPIEAGGRLTGKAGKYSIGLLNIQTGDSPADGALATNFTVVRLKRDILRRSNIGILGTRRSRSVAAGGANDVVGLDANFSFFQSLNVLGYYARSRTPGLIGDDRSSRVRLDYSSDRYGLEVEQLAVGDQFNPEVGFLRRKDFRRRFAQARFSPRPKSIEAIRKVIFEASFDHFTNGRRQLESRQAQGAMRIDLSNGDEWRMDYQRNFEFLEQPFNIAKGVAIPVGGYYFPQFHSAYRFGPQREVSGFLTFGRGAFYGGERTDVGYRGRVELTPKVSVEPGLSVNWVDVPQGRFTAKLVSARANIAFSPAMLLAALLQYNSSADSLSTNVRFRWEYRSGSDFFIVYSDGRDTSVEHVPTLVNRSLTMKLTRLVRF